MDVLIESKGGRSNIVAVETAGLVKCSILIRVLKCADEKLHSLLNAATMSAEGVAGLGPKRGGPLLHEV